ncbi:LysE family translocator [Pseudoclavibacter sp. VKM Ac-2867]|uniref:LysE family translocator n=1 Tax=Pseudoclavibacter sp. VKM Ac-2867 TaxID=2783829 RepID=UPI00188BA988|nr:LysE family transporter [Pseudoclavibacter sp. VKM Ac-2867]MBF4459701.1 LysE family transporter [Pseudoclavibacter sp. VKM Ac-2867]
MDQFLAVAVAHFLALLIPGVDFFLIVRSTLADGWKVASGVCVGIAAANSTLIGAAFSGVALISQPEVLWTLQGVGGAFLTYVGWVFLRSTPVAELGAGTPRSPSASPANASWTRNLWLGAASGLLNPKNVLFYVSLAAALASARPATLVLYGAWMVLVVLAWDLFVAIVLGSGRGLAKLSRFIPLLSKAAGVFLAVFGLSMLVTLGLELSGRAVTG